MGRVIDEILNQSDELGDLINANPNDTSIIYLMALCLGVRGRDLPEVMAGAHGLMNRVLE